MSRKQSDNELKFALALGSGSARGWAHIGVLRALHDHGIRPHIVTGTSIGALVGGAYASGNLDALEKWIRPLDRLDIIRLMDARLRGGGFIRGERLFARLAEHVNDVPIESLPLKFAAVATELASGREIWLRKGSLLQAIRASIALPGIFTPAADQERFLIDGGLVNPVPISVARAMGADVVIAVNLNDGLVGKAGLAHPTQASAETTTNDEPDDEEASSAFWQKLSELNGAMKLRFESLISSQDEKKSQPQQPGIFDVVMGAINIMQDRITRSRMAGDPPDVIIAPRLQHIGVMAFDCGEEAIEEGYRAAERVIPDIKHLLGRGAQISPTTAPAPASSQPAPQSGKS